MNTPNNTLETPCAMEDLQYAEILTGVVDTYREAMESQLTGPLATVTITGQPADALRIKYQVAQESDEPIVPLLRQYTSHTLLSVRKAAPTTGAPVPYSEVSVYEYDKHADETRLLNNFTKEQADFLLQSVVVLANVVSVQPEVATV